MIVVAVLVVGFAIFVNFWTDRLWYLSFDFGPVFSTMLVTRIGLFVGFGLIMAVVVVGNAAIAYRLRPQAPAGGPAQPAARPLPGRAGGAARSGSWSASACVVGLFAGGAAAGQVETFLAWRNATPFGITDPQFGLDIGFFVFDYPWWRFVAVVRLLGVRLRRDRGGRRALPHRRAALQRSGPRRHPRRPGSPVDPGRSGRAGEGRRLLVRPVRPGGGEASRIFTGINYTADHRHRERQDHPGRDRR